MKLSAALLSGLFASLCSTTATFPSAQSISVRGFGTTAGADIALAQLDSSSRPELLLVAYRNRRNAEGEFLYRVGRNLNYSGYTENWTDSIVVSSLHGGTARGAGIAVYDLNGNRPDIVLADYTAGALHYRVGWDANEVGAPAAWSVSFTGPGVSGDVRGIAIDLAQLNDSGGPELIVFTHVVTGEDDQFIYRVGLDVQANGAVSSWSPPTEVHTGVGPEAVGAGASIADSTDALPAFVMMASQGWRLAEQLNEVGHPNGGVADVRSFNVGSGVSEVGIEFGQIDDNPRPDEIWMFYSGGNFYYDVQWNVTLSQHVLASTGWGRFTAIERVGRKSDGAGVALCDLNASTLPELLLMSYHDQAGGNTFQVRTLWEVGTQGVASNLNSYKEIKGVGRQGEGAGLAITQLPDGDARPDLILMANHSPPGSNSFRYRIVSNLPPVPSVEPPWSEHVELPGWNVKGTGAGIAIGTINDLAVEKPDMVLMAYTTDPSVSAAGEFRYRVVFDLNGSGAATAQGYSLNKVSGFGPAQGAGVALANLDTNPRTEIILMAYTPMPTDRNMFQLKIGWNLNADGRTNAWTTLPAVPGVGYTANGADMATADIDHDGNLDLVLMAYASDPREFRYKVAPLPPPARVSSTCRAMTNNASQRKLITP